MFALEKGVPKPAIKHRRSKYPFESMEVGDSFWVTNEGNNRENLRAAAFNASRKLGKLFEVHSMPNNIVRCWRVQ